MSNFNDDEHKEPLNNELTPLEARLKREEEEKKQRASKKKNGSKAGYFISGLSGVIVGALLIWLLLPSLGNQLPGTTAKH